MLLPLASIAAAVPESFSHKIPTHGEQPVAIPLSMIIPRLAAGQVVLTGAELRQCSPEYFHAFAGQDDINITLPLADVVKQVPANQFVRRNKRKVEVPDEVASVFSSDGKGLNVAKPQPAAPKPVVPKPAVPAPVPAPAAAAPAPADPASAYRAQPAATTTSAQPQPAPQAPASKISMSPQALAALKSAAAAPVAPRPAAPTQAITPTPTPAAPAAASVPLPRQTAPVVKKVAPEKAPENAPEAPKPKGELAVPLGAVCPEWDLAVRKQLADVDAQQHQIFVPLEWLEPAMKSGRVAFTWTQVAGWIRPALANAPTPETSETSLPFSLKTLAPLFMARQQSATQKRVSIDETIPDLFGGGTGGASSAQIPQRATQPAAPAAPAARSTPAPAPAPRMEPKPEATPVAPAAAAALETSIDEVAGPAGSRLGAKEIVANTARLPGVAGALLAMSDGLLVTSNTPPAIKGETIAAFLPQMFGRMNQYTKELTLGPLQQLTLGVESGQWHIIKGPNIYFAVLGKRGETLPLNLLAQVAAELSSQSK